LLQVALGLTTQHQKLSSGRQGQGICLAFSFHTHAQARSGNSKGPQIARHSSSTLDYLNNPCERVNVSYNRGPESRLHPLTTHPSQVPTLSGHLNLCFGFYVIPVLSTRRFATPCSLPARRVTSHMPIPPKDCAQISHSLENTSITFQFWNTTDISTVCSEKAPLRLSAAIQVFSYSATAPTSGSTVGGMRTTCSYTYISRCQILAKKKKDKRFDAENATNQPRSSPSGLSSSFMPLLIRHVDILCPSSRIGRV
jgi:hypothetical protein